MVAARLQFQGGPATGRTGERFQRLGERVPDQVEVVWLDSRLRSAQHGGDEQLRLLDQQHLDEPNVDAQGVLLQQLGDAQMLFPFDGGQAFGQTGLCLLGLAARVACSAASVRRSA
jgi:hypothetical protein